MKMRIIVYLLAFVSFANAMPLAHEFVDMTYVFDETTIKSPVFKEFKVDKLINQSSETFNGLWLQAEEYSSGVHVGTHIDAPAHTAKGQITVDQISPDQFFGPAAVIDITAKVDTNPNAAVTLEDLLEWEQKTGQTLNGSIVLLKSGWGRHWSNRTAFLGTPGGDLSRFNFPGFAPEACQWLVDNRKVKGLGSDSISLDTGSNTLHMPSHVIINGRGLYILENVANVDKLPLYGAKLYVFPMKIGKGSGAPTRIIARIPKIVHDLPILEA